VFSDVFATFADLVGETTIPAGDAVDSVSFLPYLLDKDISPKRRPAIVHDQRTLRDGDWKLILPGKKRTGSPLITGELYNLREDPSESRNRIREELERAKQMRAQLKAILGQSNDIRNDK
jgi:arylsulfatase A-like enzyme